MKRVLLSTLIVVTVAALRYGFAATLPTATGPLGAGSSSVVECDTNGFTFTYSVASGNVTSVTVNGIADPACEGGALAVSLANAAGTGIGVGGPVTVPTDAGTVDDSVTVPMTTLPAAPQVATAHASIAGP